MAEQCPKFGLPRSMCAHCNIRPFATSQVTTAKRQVTRGSSYGKSHPRPITSIGFNLVDEAEEIIGQDEVGIAIRPDEVLCSFCKLPTQLRNVTTASGPLYKIIKDELIYDDKKIVGHAEVILHRTRTYRACPNDVGEFNKTVLVENRDGSVTRELIYKVKRAPSIY